MAPSFDEKMSRSNYTLDAVWVYPGGDLSTVIV